ncbi:YfjD family protein [Cytobacillus firmus]|nr:YfjD family protein [Cytobacillus firmus]
MKFNSKYSFLYLGGGIVLTPFYLHLTIWGLPGLIPGKVLFKIISREKGTVISKKGTVLISDIRNINLVRNPLNLINDIVIETFNDKKIKIRTYNLLGDLDYEMIVDQYIYPYMTENTKKVWDRKADLERLRKVARYKRKEPKID